MQKRLPVPSATQLVHADAISARLPIIALLVVVDGLVVRALTKGRRQPVPGRTVA